MQLISRAAAVLRALEGQSAGLSLGRIARETGLPRPTVQRIVDALRHEDLLADDPVHGGVRLGAAIARMAASIRTDLVAFARPGLERLARTVRETVGLSVLRDGRAVLLALINAPERNIALTSQVGATWPLHSTADGKALLSTLPAAARQEMLRPPLARFTPRTPTDLPALLAEIEEVARSAVALDIEGTTEGIAAVATGLTDALGGRYAISIIVPAARFAAELETLRAALLACRDEVRAAAGLSQAGG